MGTYLCVTNTSNNKTVRVKVNDTGGFRKYGRSLDLSKAAAIKLGFVKQGTCQITYKEC
jgi:rare lipoprotein A